jgi:flagellar hook assembly protein FlgD
MLLFFLSCSTPEPEIVKSTTGQLQTKHLFEIYKKPAEVSIYIRNGERIKTIAENLRLTQGSQSHGWKGDNDKGEFQTTGIYIGAVVVKGNKTYKTTVEIFHW